MRTRLTEDELAVRDAFHDFFANESPPTTVRAAAEGTGLDRTLWEGLSAHVYVFLHQTRLSDVISNELAPCPAVPALFEVVDER